MKLFINQVFLSYTISAKTPVRNPNFTPVPNGCGPKVSIPTGLLPNRQFERCCDNHDRCYGRCNSGQANCDSAFLSCMMSTCSDSKCRDVANLFYKAVNTAGCIFLYNWSRKGLLV